MNFMSIIGIMEKIEFKTNDECTANVYLKIDNVYYKSRLDQFEYQIIPIRLNKQIFKKELKFLKPGAIVGIKGRVEYVDSQIQLIGERIKIF